MSNISNKFSLDPNTFPARDKYTTDEERIGLFKNLIEYKLKFHKFYRRKQYLKTVTLPKEDSTFEGLTCYLTYQDEDYGRVIILSDYFIDKCKKNCQFKNFPTPAQYFKKNYYQLKNELIERRLELTPLNIRELIYTKIIICGANNPGIIKFFINRFNAKTVLDPFAGWGDRLLGAMSSNVDIYTGIDPNSCLHPAYRKMIDLFTPYISNQNIKIEMIKSGFENYQPQREYDLVFSSPPYFDYEIYTHESTQSISGKNNENVWYQQFLKPSIEKCTYYLKNEGHIVLYLSQEKGRSYVNRLINWLRNLPNIYYLGCIYYSDSKFKSIQPIFIFQKNMIVPKNLYNPELYIRKINMLSQNYSIICDDIIVGGTYTRAIVDHLTNSLISTDKIIINYDKNKLKTLSVAFGLYLTKEHDVKLVIESKTLINNLKLIKNVYHRKTVIQEYNDNHKSNDIVVEAESLYDILYQKLSSFLNFEIKRMWIATNSIDIVKLFHQLLPKTQLLVAHNTEQPFFSTIKSYQCKMMPGTFNAEFMVDDCLVQLLQDYGKDNDFIWNLGFYNGVVVN